MLDVGDPNVQRWAQVRLHLTLQIQNLRFWVWFVMVFGLVVKWDFKTFVLALCGLFWVNITPRRVLLFSSFVLECFAWVVIVGWARRSRTQTLPRCGFQGTILSCGLAWQRSCLGDVFELVLECVFKRVFKWFLRIVWNVLEMVFRGFCCVLEWARGERVPRVTRSWEGNSQVVPARHWMGQGWKSP